MCKILVLLAASGLFLAGGQWPAERHSGTTPTREQMAWQDLEYGMFCHFGLNTFHDVEWGDGTFSPKDFKPTEFNADQWAEAAKAAGMKYLVVTAKHHDGFCLWPSKYSDYSVKSSPWRDGRGDVVKEVSAACKRAGLKFGFYLSPWDRHEPSYKNATAYDEHFMNQLHELLTGYGEVAEVWFDGAGSEGHQYDWEGYYRLIKKLQPKALTAIAGVADIRWAGNEDGLAPDTLWNLQTVGDKPYWSPAECDVPIRGNHWFWHPNDESSLRPLADLVEIYHRSVGNGANLLLNVAPDRHGLLPESDVTRLKELHSAIQAQYGTDLAKGAKEQRRASAKEGTVEILLRNQTTFDRMMLAEDIAGGQHIDHFWIEKPRGGAWLPLGEGTTIGHKKLLRWSTPLTAIRLRIRYTTTGGEGKVAKVGLYKAG